MVRGLYILFAIGSIFICNDQILNLSFYNYNLSENHQSGFGNEIKKPMVMSLLVPGLGQYIQGNKKRAALFFSIELLAIYLQNLNFMQIKVFLW